MNQRQRMGSVIGLVALVTVACRPQVGPPISQVRGPAILAVKATPPEVDPKSASPTVIYEALAVDENGRVPGPAADITAPLLWAVCTEPKPPTENNSVGAACLDEYALPGQLGPTATTYSAPVSPDACALFGPSTPPVAQGQPPIRPRDPDVTGGYYQPVRVELLVPEDLRRAGMATADAIVSFDLERIYCGLANAPGEAIVQYGATYKLNNNPALTSLTLQAPDQNPQVVPVASGAAPVQVPVGQTIALAATWSDDSAETYPAFDVVERVLVSHREAMRVSWFATGGAFAHDITGRGEDDPAPFAENEWKAETAGLVHLWLVLHDSRGGTDFAAIDLSVGP